MIYGTPAIQTNGLVMCLDAANTKSYPKSGTTWSDLSGTSNKATLYNTPTYSSDSGGGIAFNGLNQYGLVSNVSSINPTVAVTVASFFNVSSIGSNFGPIVFKQNNYAGSNEQYELFIVNAGVGFVITGANRSQINVFSSLDYRNQNVYAVGTCDTVTDEMKLYINGVLIQTLPFTPTFDIANTPLQIGGTGVLDFGNTYTGWIGGKIYTAQIYNRALSAQEVSQNYNALKSRFNLN